MKENQNEASQPESFLGESALSRSSGGRLQSAPAFSSATSPLQGQGIVQRTQEENLATNASLNANRAGQNGNVHITADFQAKVTAFQTAVTGAANAAALTPIVQQHATDLWNYATTQIRTSGAASHADDGPVYVARLQMRTILRNATQLAGQQAEITRLIGVLERFSRGQDASQITFAVPASERAAVGTQPVKKVLISGFDPFFPNVTGQHQIAVSNPSGAAAMALDGTVVHGSNSHAVIEAITFPVRYADFDQGLVENAFRSYLAGPNRVDMIVTMSLDPNTETDFNIEGYGTANRAGYPDNEGRYNVPAAQRGMVHSSNTYDSGLARGNAPHGRGAPNYITTKLPWHTILQGINQGGGGYNVRLRTDYAMRGSSVAQRRVQLQQQALTQALNHQGVTLAAYQAMKGRQTARTATQADLAAITRVENQANSIFTQLQQNNVSQVAAGSQPGDYFSDAGMSRTQTMDRGSGGSYLSNEIFYRTGRLAADLGSTVPFGHIHVPNNRRNGTFSSARNEAIKTKVEEIIRASLPAL